MNKKKALAAVAAVMMMMKTKNEEAVYSAPKITEPEPDVIAQPPAARPLNIWGISGRQSHMQANSMMQLRMFK